LVGVLGGTFAVLLAAMVGEDTLKLKDWLIAEALRVIGGVAATAGADGVKLKVLGELAPAASGLPPKVKVVPPLGGATGGEGGAAATNENTPFPFAADGGGMAAASPKFEGEPKLKAAPVPGVLVVASFSFVPPDRPKPKLNPAPGPDSDVAAPSWSSVPVAPVAPVAPAAPVVVADGSGSSGRGW